MIRILSLTTFIVAATGTALVGHAQDALLWKVDNTQPASVVPPYANQVSPFPQIVVEAPVEEVSDASVVEAMVEQQRVRDEAFSHTDNLIKSGRGFEPMLSGLSVGGVLDGLLGKRVLLNNQWVGVGSSVDVRRVRTREMTEAINSLKEYDAEAATQMSGELNTALSASGTIRLTVKKIEPTVITLASPSGQTYTIPISINNR